MTTSATDHGQLTTDQHQRSLENAVEVARICDAYRGRDTLVLDLTGITPICDYFVITTGTNRRQIHAIADEVNRVLKQSGTRRRGREGYDESSWVVQDYGDVVLHVFTPETRTLYDLENLWGDAPHVAWDDSAESE
ncbi:MAG: ribosome silencing factor [Planctomycetaceae bacterium]|nr:ribosome silencing factor [Planctomycetaceae bacterium]